MARVVANSGFNTYDPAGWQGRPTFMGSNQMTITDGFNSTVIKGNNLTYSWDGRLTGGTVTSYQYFQGEQLRGTIDNFSVWGGTVGQQLSWGDYGAFYRTILQGNDSVFTNPSVVSNTRLGGHTGDDTITIGGSNNQVFAGAGNDRITLTSGTAYINGEAGFDMVYLPGNGASYNQGATQAGWQFWNNSINTQLVSIERVVFNDGVRAFDFDGNAGVGFRLYQAAFAREPDAGGLGYWIKSLDAGQKTVHGMAGDFIYSPEFIAKYGTPQTVSNGQYIELLYINALGRQLDQSGYDYWNGQLNSGRMDRADLLQYFADSAENRQQTAAEIADGIWYV